MITLGPSGNFQNNYIFMVLNNNKKFYKKIEYNPDTQYSYCSSEYH